MKILLATGIESLDTKLKNELISEGHEVKEVYYREADMEGFDLVVLSPSLSGKKALVDMIYSLRKEDTRVVLLAGSVSESELKKVISLGAYDILFDPIKHTDVMDVIKNPRKFKEVSDLISKTDGEGSGQAARAADKVIVKAVKTVIRQQILTWWSASGGEGKTTLAVAQAYMLAKETGEKVALLDFKEVTPHCSWYLGMEPFDPSPVYDAIEKGSLSRRFLEENMAECAKCPNLMVFTGVPLNRFERFQAKHFGALIDVLTSYPYIVIDTNPGVFFASTFAALRKASRINVVLEPSYRSVYDTKSVINFIIKNWGISAEIINAYVNKMSFEGLDIDTISMGLMGIEVSGSFNYDKRVLSAQNSGRPYTKGFQGLLKGIDIPGGKKKKGILSFLRRGEAVGID